MAAYTSTQAGDWSDTATWGASGPPGDGDSATIEHAVAVDTNTIVGTSGAAGTIDVIVESTGSLVIETGVTLTVRGDLQLQDTTLTLNAGSHYRFGNGGSAEIYKLIIGSANSQANSKLICNGSSGSRCTIGKEAGAGNGIISRWANGASAWTAMRCTFTDFSDLGGTGTGFGVDAIEWNPSSAALEVYIEDCTFTGCGRLMLNAINAAADFVFRRNKIENCTSSGLFGIWLILSSTATGDRIFTDNVLDSLNHRLVFQTSVIGLTFDRNVLRAVDYSSVTAGPMASCADNMIYVRVSGTGNVNCELGEPGTTIDGLYFIADTAAESFGMIPAGMGGSTGTVTVDGVIWDISTALEGMDCLRVHAPAAAQTLAIQNSIILPNARRGSGGTIPAHGGANLTVNVVHNTLMAANLTGSSTGEAALYSGSGYAGHAGMYPTVRSNIIWAEDDQEAEGDGYVIFRAGAGPGQTPADVFTTAGVTHNGKYNLKDGTVFDESGANGVTKNGYHALWNTDQDVGANDIDSTGTDVEVDGPAFFDTTRNVATFDSAYLGNAPAAWADATVYAVGDIRSASDAGFYGGETINYRCVTAHTSATGHATNGKPGVAASYRTNWEFAGVYRVRTAILAGTTITDSALGLTNANYVEALRTWVQYGYRVQNATWRTGAHDGTVLGAVQTEAITPDLSVAVQGGAAVSDGGTDALGTKERLSVVTRSYTITNDGAATITLGTITVEAGLTKTADPSGLTIAPTATRTLTVSMSTATSGAKDLDISIPSDDAASPYNWNVTATVEDTTVPVLVSAVYNRTLNIITLTYDEDLDAVSEPGTGDFAVDGVNVVAISMDSATKVFVEVDADPDPGSTLDYTAGVNPIQDVAGNDAANLTNQFIAGLRRGAAGSAVVCFGSGFRF